MKDFKNNVSLETMIITNDPKESVFWEKAGVDIIFIDLEVLGKSERQGHVDSVKSVHDIGDIAKIKPLLTSAKILVRVNPPNKETCSEIEKAIEGGADIIMLPMFETIEEILCAIDQIDGRCEFYPLIETPLAVELVPRLIKLKGIQGFHFGLNDLHLAMGFKFMFEVMLWPKFIDAVKVFDENNVFFGIGGVSKVGTGALLSDVIIRENFRVGSKRVILSRSFKAEVCSAEQAKIEVSNVKNVYSAAQRDNLVENRNIFVQKVREISSDE